MCGDCWNAAMAAPTAVVAARFAWVGYRDRIPFLKGRHDAPDGAPDDAVAPADAPHSVGAPADASHGDAVTGAPGPEVELVDVGPPSS